MLQETLQKVSDLWIKEGLALSKPLSPIQVNRAFENFAGQVSNDVIEVYSTLGGLENWGSDSTCFSLLDN